MIERRYYLISYQRLKSAETFQEGILGLNKSTFTSELEASESDTPRLRSARQPRKRQRKAAPYSESDSEEETSQHRTAKNRNLAADTPSLPLSLPLTPFATGYKPTFIVIHFCSINDILADCFSEFTSPDVQVERDKTPAPPQAAPATFLVQVQNGDGNDFFMTLTEDQVKSIRPSSSEPGISSPLNTEGNQQSTEASSSRQTLQFALVNQSDENNRQRRGTPLLQETRIDKPSHSLVAVNELELNCGPPANTVLPTLDQDPTTATSASEAGRPTTPVSNVRQTRGSAPPSTPTSRDLPNGTTKIAIK